jgi:hypothetical protein
MQFPNEDREMEDSKLQQTCRQTKQYVLTTLRGYYGHTTTSSQTLGYRPLDLESSRVVHAVCMNKSCTSLNRAAHG